MGPRYSTNNIVELISPPPCPPEKVCTPPPIQTSNVVYQLTEAIFPIDNIDCSLYSTDTKCEPDNIKNCEICKNFAYRDWYNENNHKSTYFIANYEDSKAEYNRTWIQTCNLGIGICLLGVGIYYQQSE